MNLSVSVPLPCPPHLVLGIQIHLQLISTRLFYVWDLASIGGNLGTGLSLDHELVGCFDHWICINVSTCCIEVFLPLFLIWDDFLTCPSFHSLLDCSSSVWAWHWLLWIVLSAPLELVHSWLVVCWLWLLRLEWLVVSIGKLWYPSGFELSPWVVKWL